MLLYASFVLFIVYGYVKKRFKENNILTIFGSLAFFVFFLNSLFFKDNLFAHVYVNYVKILETTLNLGLIGSFLFIFLILSVIANFFTVVLRFIRSINNSIFKKISLMVFKIILAIMVIGGIFLQDAYRKTFFGGSFYIKTLAEFIIPFIGFSLVYVHGNLLLKFIKKYVYKKTVVYCVCCRHFFILNTTQQEPFVARKDVGREDVPSVMLEDKKEIGGDIVVLSEIVAK